MIIVPLINPLRYVRQGYSDNYQTKYFDLHLFPQTIRKFEEPVDYVQPFELDDPLVQIFNSDKTIDKVSISYYRVEDGALVLTEVPTQLSSEDVNGTTFYTYLRTTDLNDLGEGEFYSVINADTLNIESNRICVHDEHPGTVQAKYRHHKFYEDVIWEKDDNLYMYLRVPGFVNYNKPKKVSTTYEDQVLNMTAIRNVPFNSWSYITDSKGMPPYMIDLTNRVFGCSTLSLDGRLFTIPQESEWEEKEEDLYPMSGWGIDMREKVTKSSLEYGGSNGGGPSGGGKQKEPFSDWWPTVSGDYKLTGSSTSGVYGYTIDQIDEIIECDRDGRQFDLAPSSTPGNRQYYHNTGADEVEFESAVPFNGETIFLLFTLK